jgi:TRL (tRNA-associated locus)-like protein
MKNLLMLLALGAAGVSVIPGCAMATGGQGSLTGFIYSGYKMGGAVGPGAGTQTGEACASSILCAFASGDASIAAAKAAGGITQVAHIDHNVTSILGIYATSCTVAVGQ